MLFTRLHRRTCGSFLTASYGPLAGQVMTQIIRKASGWKLMNSPGESTPGLFYDWNRDWTWACSNRQNNCVNSGGYQRVRTSP
jgi:hypothetical protein